MAANDARERGNALYRQRKLNEAECAYSEALSLEPENPLILSNLSAVHFEMGKYAEAARFAANALAVSADQPDDKKDRLNVRLAKSCLYALDTAAADKALGSLGGEHEVLAAAIRDTARSRMADGMAPSSASWTRLFDRMPRYKPCLYDEPEYYAFGHDTAEPIFDDADIKAGDPKRELAYLFCGSGDARNIFSTMIVAALLGLSGGKKTFKTIHFTLVDLKPPALARTLIVFELLTEFLILKAHDRSENAGNMSTLSIAYIYASHILPPFLYKKLQEIIKRMIEGLEENATSPYFKWLYVEPSTKAQILHYLRSWQQPPTGKLRTENVRKAARENIRSDRARGAMMFGDAPSREPLGAPRDRELFEKLTFIPPPQRYMAKIEPELLKLVTAYESKEAGAYQALEKYLDDKWQTNITIFDPDWEEKRHIPIGTVAVGGIASAACDPFELARDLLQNLGGRQAINDDTLIEGVMHFFSILARALLELQADGRMTMEMIAGEMGDVADRLRYDALAHRKQGAIGEGLDPSRFPRKFDRIHLSNIPDYVGGLMATHLFLQPLLRDASSNLRFNVLLNPLYWSSHDDFSAEYLLLPHVEIPRHFGIRLQSKQDCKINGKFFMGIVYWIWENVDAKRLRGPKLLNRAKLEHWLYAHFLKLVLPWPRAHMSSEPLVAPLNITALIRLVVRMHETGYPAHWLAGVLEALCSGKITTTARPPQMLVTSPSSAVAVHPAQEIDIGPWTADFTTSLSLWRGLLPFGIAPPKGTLVSLGEIEEYSITFQRFLTGKAQNFPHFALVFWDTRAAEPPADLREALLKEAERSVAGEASRKAHVVTTFKFVTNVKEASFWMRSDIAKQVLEEDGWKAWIWRTDSWEKESDGVDIRGGMRKKRTWLESLPASRK